MELTKKWRKRLTRLSIAAGLMGVSFTVGVAMTLFIAVRLLAPVAATGMMLGVVGMASAQAHATTNALYAGDSEMRLTVLRQLKGSLESQPSQTLDAAAANWILPALEQCQSDADPEVVALADELIDYVKENTVPSLQ